MTGKDEAMVKAREKMEQRLEDQLSADCLAAHARLYHDDILFRILDDTGAELYQGNDIYQIAAKYYDR